MAWLRISETTMEFYFSEIERDVLIITADGGLNAQTADQFVDDLASVINAGATKIIVDCSKLQFISSYGLGVLVRVHTKLARRGGDVKIAAVQGPIQQVLELTHLNRLFEIYPDVNRARLAFRPKDAGPGQRP
jgi:anti-anti-sigma factor